MKITSKYPKYVKPSKSFDDLFWYCSLETKEKSNRIPLKGFWDLHTSESSPKATNQGYFFGDVGW